MKKQHPESPIPSSSWEESEFLHWLSTYGKQIAMGLLLVLVLAVIAYRFFAGSSSVGVRDYVEADNAFYQLTQPPVADGEPINADALATLNTLLLKHPELQAKYDGLLTQLLLNRGANMAALQYGQRSQARTGSENQPFYATYAETTLLIGSNQYEDALQRALALQQEMDANRQTPQLFGDTLYAFNLLRIGSLQQQLGLKTEENETWTRWKRLVKESNDINLTKALTTFNVGNIAIADYIDARQKILQNILN